MNKTKADLFTKHTQRAFQDVAQELLMSEYVQGDGYQSNNPEKIVIIIGITGNIKGRIQLECDMSTANMLTVDMNQGDPLDDPKDLYLYMAEFANMVCGRAATYINNEFNEREAWLAPPAVFSGESLEILSPGIRSELACFNGKQGSFVVDVGIEGVN